MVCGPSLKTSGKLQSAKKASVAQILGALLRLHGRKRLRRAPLQIPDPGQKDLALHWEFLSGRRWTALPQLLRTTIALVIQQTNPSGKSSAWIHLEKKGCHIPDAKNRRSSCSSKKVC